MMRHCSIFVSAVAFAAAMAGTTLERLSLTDMTDKSHIVVRATVLGSAAEYTGGVVRTHYHLNVTEVWKGAAATQLDVYVPGGRAGGVRELVPGAPVLDTGAEYVIFLWVGTSGRPQIIGLSQGLFNVVKDSAGTILLERPGAKESMIDPATGNSVTDQAVRMKAADVKALVKKRI